MKKKSNQYWDLIGDIHGRSESLVSLLQTLGYLAGENGYSHPEGRKVIFVGDFIDKGPNSLDALRLARRMTDAGNALAVMGNHEFNFVSYLSPDGEGGFLRERSERNVAMVKTTLESFHGRPQELSSMVEWMKALPFFLELDGLRVVHASWIPEDIEFLRGKSLRNFEFLALANRKGTREHRAVENVLKGVEAPLPEGVTLPDANGIERSALRVKWWTPLEGKTWAEVAFPPREDLPEEKAAWGAGTPGIAPYPEDLPPTFIGHYKLVGYEPFAATGNIASLDYGLAHGGKATAYRWSGEEKIRVENFVQVDEVPDGRFEVWIDDNFHYMDEEERVSGGLFLTYEDALARAIHIVEGSLSECYKEGMTAEILFSTYRSFGEDPWILPTPAGRENFSAWTYAEERTTAFIQERSRHDRESHDG